MVGIYSFTNKSNNKVYIGQSIHLEERYHQHRRNHLNENDNSYNSKFYRALRKYGFDNFDYQILIQDDNLTKNQLNELEIYFISYYDSFKNGYNETRGGQFNEHFVKLTSDQINQIYQLLKNPYLTMTEIAEQMNVSNGLIYLINKGKVWYNKNETYPIRNSEIGRARGQRVNTSLSTDKEVIEMRKLFVDHTLEEIYELYKDKYSFSGMKKIIYGVNHKHLPIYKKREKAWFLNGTCIDYPG